MQNQDVVEGEAAIVPGELTFARVAAIDRDMRTLRARLNDLEAQKAGLMTRLMAGLVAKSQMSDRAVYRPAAPTSRDRASIAVTSEPSTGQVDPPTIRPSRELVEGRAPYGFATKVRMVAHRSIALANRPLQRAEILDDVMASGIPLPKAFLPQKVSRVLARDEELVKRRGEGYELTAAALGRELRLIRKEEAGSVMSMSGARIDRAVAEVDDDQDDVTSGYDGPPLG